MKGPKEKWLSTGRLRRTVLMLGVAGATAGAALLTAGAAQALSHAGSQPGNLTFSPASGSATASGPSITWSTTTGCPSGFQGSAQLNTINSNGTLGSTASAIVAAVATPFSGTLTETPAQAQSLGTDVPFGTPFEFAVACFASAGGNGASEFVQSNYMTITSATGTYTTGVPTVTATSTTLTSSPNPANSGATVTLTAVATATGGTHPPGTVQFFNGATAINATGIAVDATGTASTTTSFPAAGSFTLTAVFTPTDTTTFSGSTSNAVQQAVNTAGSLTAGGGNPIPINVTVAASGTLTVTVAANTGVTLAVNGLVATGTLPTVQVVDTRNTFPGWSVSGTQSVFQGPGTNTISASQLGWTPAAVGALTGGATAGPAVAPGTVPGLASASVLGSAPAGQGAGTNNFNAALTLDIPSTAAAGSYTGNMTITYLDHN